ncbi:uncharacterized protein LOC101863728 [Aplysia californica]|uniref:Uncharacterized protein LOC101863728 n=1 Tax=Aplysia californica TaxID=6500 RepID=A0ABM0JGS7_APLCA|nr:uncharacterized protein LOC101863728 [Aplysia californica]XP_005093340.1 uncharacterized protein LOC101863728 [Aplysia californica]
MRQLSPQCPSSGIPSVVIQKLSDCGRSHKMSHDSPYTRDFMPTCGELGIPLMDDCRVADFAYCNNSTSGNNNSNSMGVSVNRYSDHGSGVYSRDCVVGLSTPDVFRFGRLIHSPGLQIDGLKYESQTYRVDPYSPVCMVPLPGHMTEPTFVRRRNERERERVRCVNEGYDRLKEHLPLGNKDRRISKVETLRHAIDYIRGLRQLLQDTERQKQHTDKQHSNKHTNKRTYKHNNKHATSISHSPHEDAAGPAHKRRRPSLTSSGHGSPESDVC